MTHSLADRSRTATLLAIDPETVVATICDAMRRQVGEILRRRGCVVAMSGGVDSAVCAALAARAVGAERVLAVFMPERDSDPRSLDLASGFAGQLGIPHLTECITPALEALACYARRDAAIRRVVPAFGDGWRSKVVLPGDHLRSDRLSVSRLVVEAPDGTRSEHRLPADVYREIVAATNFKQRVRKMLEYHHADRLHYAVVGTPNRLEYDQGFFVKGGDGLADLKPIAHLFKTQVYQLAEYLEVPDGIRRRPTTTDTYSLPQTQEEFYFRLPPAILDLILDAHGAGEDAAHAAERLGLAPDHVARAYRELEQKRRTTAYLHSEPLLVEPVDLGSRPGGRP